MPTRRTNSLKELSNCFVWWWLVKAPNYVPNVMSCSSVSCSSTKSCAEDPARPRNIQITPLNSMSNPSWNSILDILDNRFWSAALYNLCLTSNIRLSCDTHYQRCIQAWPSHLCLIDRRPFYFKVRVVLFIEWSQITTGHIDYREVARLELPRHKSSSRDRG